MIDLNYQFSSPFLRVSSLDSLSLFVDSFFTQLVEILLPNSVGTERNCKEKKIVADLT